MINSIAFSLIALCIIYISSLSTCSLLLSCAPNKYGMIGIAALVFTTMLGPLLIILEDNRQ